MSYSQADEERYILEACRDIKEGTLLDIGAWHPTDMSNSRALIERGWRAVLVEPSPLAFRNLLCEYSGNPKVTLVHCGVGVERSLIPFWDCEVAASTAIRANVEKWQPGEIAFSGPFYVSMVTVDDLFRQFNENGFQFINIDTEGMSFGILHDLLKTQMNPRCICVEHDGRIEEMQKHVQHAGYRTAYTSNNLVLVRK